VLTRTRIRSVFDAYDIDKVIDLDKESFGILNLSRHYDYVIDCEPYLNISAIISFFLGKRRIGFSDQWRSMLYNNKTRFRKDQHMVQNYLDMIRLIGIRYDTDKLENLQVSKKAMAKVDGFVKRLKAKKIIGITPGVAETVKSRMWFEDRFARLADKLIEKDGVVILFIDGPSNKDVVVKIRSMMKQKSINCVGRFSLEETFYLIKKCDVFISNDTGPMHIAAAQGTRTIGLFGPNTPVLWGPYGKNNISIYKTRLPPSIQNDKGTFKDVDREGYMGSISVDDVYEAAVKLL
ncbi:MAG: glycosyltransferase family 9 protein, partial [Candidatus Woesearchaeota archaeon]|nr:glycosyltransferase family 9 protein [Candidatus Woesearchaeota archaeon]